MDSVFDVPLLPCPGTQVSGLGIGGGQRHDQVRRLAAGLGLDRTGTGNPHSLPRVGETQPTRVGHRGQRHEQA